VLGLQAVPSFLGDTCIIDTEVIVTCMITWSFIKHYYKRTRNVSEAVICLCGHLEVKAKGDGDLD
jgi:hypothetical protein